MPVRNLEHERLSDRILYAFGSRPDIRVWPRDVGYDSVKKIKYGQKGEPDIDGIVAPFGIRIGIEVKTGNAKLSKDQEKWKNLILKFGGIFIEARSVEQALEEFDRQYKKWIDETLRKLVA